VEHLQANSLIIIILKLGQFVISYVISVYGLICISCNFMISASHQIYSGDKVKQGGRGGACGTRRSQQMCMLGFGAEPHESKGQVVRPRRSCEDNLDLKEMGWLRLDSSDSG
jgi:hypothetical protein